jgi:Skp family chaperone for outer membrane proteins
MLIAAVAVARPTLAGSIGFVDVERAAASVEEGKAKFQEIQDWADPRRDQIGVLQEQVRALREQISQQRNVASEEALQRLIDEELQVRRRYEDAARDFERDVTAKQEEMLRDVAYKINIITNDYAKANDFDAVFITKDSMLIFLSESADLTDTVIRLYNERFPVQD